MRWDKYLADSSKPVCQYTTYIIKKIHVFEKLHLTNEQCEVGHDGQNQNHIYLKLFC